MDDWYDSLDHTMPELLRAAAARGGGKPFIVGESGEAVSFADSLETARRIGAALIARGVGPGDRVAIWAPNSERWILAALGIEAIGAVMVPLNTRFKAIEAEYVLRKSGARALFLARDFLATDHLAMLRDAYGGPTSTWPVAPLKALECAIAIDRSADGDGAVGWASFIASGADVAAADSAMGAVQPSDTCDILFTSGTTGQPKGAMHGHGQAIWMPGIWNRSNDLRADDRMLIVNPFFHSFGYRSGWVSALLAGMTCYPMAVFDVDRIMKVIAAERISVLMGPPTLFAGLLDHPDRAAFDLSSLRVGHTGAANVAVSLIERVRDELPFDLFLTSYGLTEATALVSVCHPDDSPETIASTVGRPLPGVALRIVDGEGQDLPVDGSGELLVRGPNVMQGYFEDEAATRAAISPDGWLATGDVGTIARDGTLRILDRLKDVVIVGGFNAYPAEIEHMLAQHPAIAEVAVIGIPDARLGEVAAAFAVLRNGAALTPEDLIAWSRARMANFKVPRRLFVIDALPRTPLGKVRKFELVQQARAQRAAEVGTT